MVPVRLPIPSDPDPRKVLDRQVAVMSELAEEVLDGVTLEECLWRSSDRSWTVHERDDGWFGELDEEPPDLPTPSLGWTMWHPIWWLSVLLAHANESEAPTADTVKWPGPSESLPLIRSHWSQWTTFVDGLDDEQLSSGTLTRFPYDDDRPFVYIIGWASMELTKNLSEMCVIRRLVHELRPT